MQRNEIYAHAKPQDSAGKVVFFPVKASEGGVCSALALRAHSLSTPQVSTHYLKIGGRKV